MHHMRRIAVLLACLTACATAAQEWPQKTVRIVNTFAAGVTTDTVARVIAQDLQQRLGVPFIVESRPGAAGMIGANEVAKAAPDGHTLGVSNGGPLANNVLLYKNMLFDPFRDIKPVTLAAHQPCSLVAHKDLQVSSVQELIAELKRHPGKYNYAQIGSGGVSNLLVRLITSRADAEVVSLAYDGSSAAALAVMRGDAHFACLPSIAVLGHVKSGAVRALAVSTKNRAGLMPDVPTLEEAGLPGVVGTAWIGVFAPGKTPHPLLERINKEVVKALKRPEAVALLGKQMMEVVAGSPEEFEAFRREEVARWKPVVEQYKISLD